LVQLNFRSSEFRIGARAIRSSSQLVINEDVNGFMEFLPAFEIGLRRHQSLLVCHGKQKIVSNRGRDLELSQSKIRL
jgi:hypothetical protein